MYEKIIMKTVLMICPFAKPNIGGVESHLEKLMSYLSKRKYKVILVTYQPLTTKVKAKKYERKENVEIYRVSWFGVGWFHKLEPYFPLVFIYLFPALFLKTLVVFLKRHKEVDVIHAHGFIAAAITGALAMIFKKHCVVSTHAIYKFQERKLLAIITKCLLGCFTVILAVGEPSKRELVAIGLSEKKIKIHPNWIDTEIFRPYNREECRRELGLNNEEFVVLYLGRLIEIKGVSVLLAVADSIDRDIKFIFVGDGPLSSRMKNAAKSNQRLRYYGRLSDNDIIKAYSAADLFISPILYEEGFATVYLESLACGTPVVTAKRGCLPYFLAPEVADLLEVINTETVLKILEYYFENKNILDGKRSLCRKYAEQYFSEKNAEIILSSY